MDNRSTTRLCVLALLLTAAPVAAQVEPADMILRSGRLWTGDDARPYASALAIRGNEIVAVGSD